MDFNPQVTSFGYCMREVDIFSDKGVKMDYYSENGDWDIKSMGYSRSVYYDGGYPYSKVDCLSRILLCIF